MRRNHNNVLPGKGKTTSLIASAILLIGISGCSPSPEENEIDKLTPIVEEAEETVTTPPLDEKQEEEETPTIEDPDGLSEADRNVVDTVETIHMMATDVVAQTPNYVDWEVNYDSDLQATMISLHKAEEDMDENDPFEEDGAVTSYLSYSEEVILDITLERDSAQRTVVTVTGWSEDADIYTEDNPLVYSGE